MKIKTIVFLVNNNGGYINKYSQELLMSLVEVRLVVIVNAKMLHAIKEDIKSQMAEIYCVNEVYSGFYYYYLDTKSVEEIIKAELSLVVDPLELMIVTQNESCVELAASLRRKFNIPGDDMLPIDLFTNKSKMKTELNKLRIKTPQSGNLESYPMIVKPIEAAGAYGVRLVNSPEEFDFDQDDYMREQFIKGDLYHCDIIFANKVVKIALCSKYNYPLLDFMSGTVVGSYALNLDDKLGQSINSFVGRSLLQLGVTSGLYHAEVFLCSETNEFVMLEIAARGPGGGINEVYQKMFDINLIDLDLNIKMNLENYPAPIFTGKYCFWAFIPPEPGIVGKLNEPAFKGQASIIWRISQGDKLIAPCSLRDRVGELIVINNTYQDMMLDLELINKNKLLEVF